MTMPEEDIDYESIDGSELGEDDLRVVKNEIVKVTARYYNLGLELDIPPYELEKLKTLRMEDAFNETLLKWLRGSSTKSPPTPPSWRSVVRAVASQFGGNNYALAKVIASRHKAQAQAPQAQDKEEVADKEEAGQNTSMTGSRAIDKKPAAKSQWGNKSVLFMIAVVVCVASVAVYNAIAMAGQGVIIIPTVSSVHDIDKPSQEPINNGGGPSMPTTPTPESTTSTAGTNDVNKAPPIGFPDILNERPKMNQLVILERSGGRDPVRIIERIGAQNSEIGTILLNDERGVIMDTIKHNARGNAQATNKEMFRRWLVGGGAEVSWKVLVDTLEKLQFKALADDIVDALKTMS